MQKIKVLSLFVVLGVLALGVFAIVSTARGPISQDKDLAPGVKVKVAEELVGRPLTKEEIERVRSRGRWDISLSVPRYSQNSSPWNDDNMEVCDETIGDAGCTLTSATMVFAYYGSSLEPDDVNTCMGNSACLWVWADGEDCSNNEADWDGALSASYAALVLSLMEGYPSILQLRKGSDNQHWVVVKAVSGSGTDADDFTINDPSNGQSRGLDDYIDDGWWMNVIAIYTPR